ncbi:MAG: tRNA (cytidine/uridine-2'-O-)-methyltransferase TrmJ [Nitrospiraceae bacterium]|nr:MAG: tRNA (cytidine/uridine-2'-O-)-methyltransferase TrmJ [Nitrospiraceae bacterium]
MPGNLFLGVFVLNKPGMTLETIRIVLVRPAGAANVGAVARAMKNMGLRDLVVVRPRFRGRFWMRAMAVHAHDILERMRVVSELEEAVGDCGLVIGTSCRSGLYRAPTGTARELAPEIVGAAQTNTVAIVFGPEDHGLSNEDLKVCHRLVTIPASPAYPSLNLAQAVMIVCYEVFVAAQQGLVLPVPRLARAEDVEFMFQRLREALLRIGYAHAQNPDHILFAFRRFLGRAGLEERDVKILLGLARQIEWYGDGGWRVIEEKQSRQRAVGSVEKD